jgi:hypothetical protein
MHKTKKNRNIKKRIVKKRTVKKRTINKRSKCIYTDEAKRLIKQIEKFKKSSKSIK